MESILTTKDEQVLNLEKIWVRRILTAAKQRKQASKILEAQSNDTFAFSTPSAAGAFDIPDEPIPTTNEGREKYFMNHLQLGEQLMLQGLTYINTRSSRL